MLRPVSFSIPSSTELKVAFNGELTELLGKDNFLIESISGNIDDLEVVKVTVEGSFVIVKTRPQVAGNYYVLKLLDSDDVLFASSRGIPLVNDDVTRKLFFVGLKNHNPVRDRMLINIPRLYDLENSNVSNIINAQAEEIFQAQKHIGELLSDNYIIQEVIDEQRTRSSGATDRLFNENAYVVERVSSNPTKNNLIFRSLDYSSTSTISRHTSIPKHPIALQEIYVKDEEISLSSEGNSFKGFLISLKNKNIIKLISLKLIRSTDEEDCNGDIGTEYNILTNKYSINSNRYDPSYAFSYIDLKSNQVLLSEFGNIDEPTVGDTIKVSYLYKDTGRKVNEASIEVYNLKQIDTESIPTNITRFFLDNAPIVDANNSVPERGGVTFAAGENTTEASEAFRLELVFNSSKLPSKIGEYAINYSTGEVIVVGAEEVGEGTGSKNNIATYLYRNVFSKNLDYYIKDDEFVAASNRSIVDEEVNIDFNYDKVYVESVDYKAPCHTEILNEHVANDFASSFVINPKNTPVTNVFRIYNQTTGEVYSSLYHTDDEIYFTGRRSPEFKTENNELAKFDLVELERLEPIGEFVCPVFSVEITANASNDNIQFFPGIPAELIDYNSQNYFIRSKGLSGSDDIEDLQIKFFGSPDSNNLISSMAINAAATAPSLKEDVTIGTKGLTFSLDKTHILNDSEDAIGSYVNSSIEFTKSDLFSKEKYFKDIETNPGTERAFDSNIVSSIASKKGEDFYENLSRLRKVGDYSIDYKHGQIYLAVSYNQNYELGYVNYRHGSISTFSSNIISIVEASKKLVSSDTLEDASIVYENPTNTADKVTLLDLEPTLLLPDEKTTAFDLHGKLKDICVILDDYTVVLPTGASDMKGVYSLASLEGAGLTSSVKASRKEDLGSSSVNELAEGGGGNIFNPIFMSFEDNIIDLKKTHSTRLAESGSNYEIVINDSSFDEVYKIIHTPTDSEIFDEKLNVLKIDGLEIVNTEASGANISADIKSGIILDSIDTSGDFLLDSDDNRFTIVSFDAALSKIVVSVPAENNISASSPALGSAQVIVKSTVVTSSSGVTITIPSDSYVNKGDPVNVIYKTTFVPEVGTKVGVDYRAGRLYLSYVYSYDDVYVSYEYGDNQIDWSVGSAINEGETYYATYKYGALRDALRKNFGVLTKIPFFQRFPLTTDRELYRSALAGTVQAFTKGPTIPAFRSLVESFTDITPGITESVFGNWILGREYLNPQEIKIDGTIEFKPCKFEEGIMIKDDTVVSVPAISNINLDEGTISAWVCPEWAGIDNDATLTIHIDNIGLKHYAYKLGDNIFDYKNGFNVLSSEDAVGGVDSSAPSVTIHNYTSSWVDDIAGGEEEELIGAFALVKEEASISRVVKTELDISLKVSSFSAPNDINPPRRRASEDLAFNIVNLGILGLGRSLSDASRGLIAEGSEDTLYRFCSPAFISIGDKEKLLFSMFSMRPLINPDSGKIYTFRVGDEHIEHNEIPDYNRLHITRNCKCAVDDTLAELSKFRDKDFQSIRIELDFNIDFSYIGDTDVPFDDQPSAFRVLDTRGAVYEVYAFLDEDQELVLDSIPDTVSGFVVNRIPENQQYITAQGADAINSLLPTGEITVLYQTLSILTKTSPDAATYLGYEAKSYIVDWMSDYVDLSFVRDPMKNNVKVVITSSITSEKKNIDLFYTDLIDVEAEAVIYSSLNLDKWFNIAGGIVSVDNSSSLSDKIAVGTLDRTSKSVIDINSLKYSIHNRFDEADIYIGASARNPRRIPFEVNKSDFPDTSVGLPYNADSAEGVFIGFDELCLSPLADDVGQWVLRTRASESVYMPTGVAAAVGSSALPYDLVYSYVPMSHIFAGVITTDGEFSSVVRAHREEDGSGCPTGLVCASEYRYCGDGVLEGEGEGDGWKKIGETSSELINILIGGAEGEASAWMKHGAFATTSSGGVYRMGPSVASVDDCNHNIADGSFAYTSLPCYGGNYSATVSFRVAEVDFRLSASSVGEFEGAISGIITGITPIHIYDNDINVKVALAISDLGQPLVLVVDGNSSEIVDISYFDWDNGLFNQLTLNKNSKTGIITVKSNSQILSKLDVDDFSANTSQACELLSEPFFAIHLFDGSLSSAVDFHSELDGNVLDLGLIEYSARYEDGVTTLEAGDFFISTDSKIEFGFSVIGEDGYADGYADTSSDGYGYGYASVQEFDVDELYFTSDKLRYIFDSGQRESENRISIFKDGKGFMNFRVFDNSLSKSGDVNMYNIATNIKSFKPGELHHVAASWRLNTLYEKDEMHLFIDGLEAPNIYKFGGPVPIRINDKFSDISKEVLQDFLVDGIDYCSIFTDGTTLAGTSTFSSSSANFAQDMVGRSIIILESSVAPTYVGKEYIINSVNGNSVTFVRNLDLDIVSFDASASDIKFMFPPTAGIKRDVATDLRNSSFIISKTDCAGVEKELGGITYTVDSGVVNIVSGAKIINPQFRVNLDTRVIEFVGQDAECNYNSTVQFSDLDIHIKTFGLIYKNCKGIINLSSSSYYHLDKKEYDINSGNSVIMSHSVEPVSLDDVYIRRIILPRTIPSIDTSTKDGSLYESTFEIGLLSKNGEHLVTSEVGQVYKKNMGRYLSINFDSDNTAFCEKVDGYIDEYADNTSENKIVVHGKTVDGTDKEEFFVRGNGEIRGEKLFKSVTKIVGTLYLADSNYEPCVIELVESNPITVSDNNGEYAEVFRYTNGRFILTVFGSNGYYPFELHPGSYHLEYPAFLNVSLPMVGDKAYIGCDINKKSQFGGTIDEFRIITEMSSDTRPTENDTDGTRSITEDYLNPNPHCPDDQTLLLSHFDDPIALQARRLRQKEFLNTENNFKFKLEFEDREKLLNYINNEDMFVSSMVRMGFDKDSAVETYIECHHAYNGPLFNESKFMRSDKMLVSHNSVNDNFGLSTRFFNTSPLVINNRLSHFRKSEGSIEFWVSPLMDTIGDEKDRYYVDVYSVVKKRIKSFSPTIIDLPTSAKEIVSIQLMEQTKEFSGFYTQDEADQILFDEVYRSQITGRLTGGTGVIKDFSSESRLSADGKRVYLEDALPGARVDVIVSYIPIDSAGDRVSVYKNSRSQIVFSIKANGVTNILSKDIDWSRNTWHRIMCTWKTNSASDTMRLFVDGTESGYILYGQHGAVYGTGFVYGQTTSESGASKQVNYNIKLKDDFRLVCIGSDVFESQSALSRLDNIRFSRIMRNASKDPSGEYIDPNYSSNIATIMPVVKDDATTLLLDFEQESGEDFYTTVIDPKSGIFNFDIDVEDGFGKIDSDEVEDLIVDLVNRLKPAHTNALVKFPRDPC